MTGRVERAITKLRVMSDEEYKDLVNRHSKCESNTVELIESCFESVEIAEYEYMICASQSEPFWIEVKQAVNILQGR